VSKIFRYLLTIRAEPTFPYFEHIPALLMQRTDIARVTFLIPGNLGAPIFRSGFWRLTEWVTAMAVPEASPYLNDFAAFEEHEVGLAGEVWSM
jgi:hypothetical protein